MGRLLEEIRDDFIPKNRKRESSGYTANVAEGSGGGQPSGVLSHDGQEQIDANSRDGNLSTTSKYMEGMSEQVLKSMLLGLRNTNTGHDVQEQIITRLGQLSAKDILAGHARAVNPEATAKTVTADTGTVEDKLGHAPPAHTGKAGVE